MRGKQKNDLIFTTIGGWKGKHLNPDGVVRDKITEEEVGRAFNFTIEKRQSYDEKGRLIPGHFHLVRSDTDEIIQSASVGAKYSPYNHKDVYRYIAETILPRVPELELETVGTLHGGGTGLFSMVKKEKLMVKGDESPLSVRLVFSNPCNATGSIFLGCLIVRDKCQNCIPVGSIRGGGSMLIHHTKNADTYVSKAVKNIKAQFDKVEERMKEIHNLSNIEISDEQFKTVLNTIYPLPGEYGSRTYNQILRKRNDVIAQYEGAETAMQIQGRNAWRMFNAFTFPIYNPKRFTDGMDEAEVMYSGMCGTRAQKALEIFGIIKMAIM